MNRYRKSPYIDELQANRQLLDLSFLVGKTLAISGATGMIGTYLIDTLLIDEKFNIKIIALVRDVQSALDRFIKFIDDYRLVFVKTNLTEPILIEEHVDYIIHAASLTSPHDYHDHPIDTMLLNFIGNKQMLDLAVNKLARYMFVSSTEVYGQSIGALMDETYSGYLNPLDVRSAYNEGKRAGETLTICYAAEHGLDVVIPRLSRGYGPTLKDSDRKALSQFLFAASRHEPIILKSQGTQKFSYTYVSDIVSALLFLLQHGKNKEAYNVGGEETLSLLEIAQLIGKIGDVKVTIDLTPDTNMSYSKAHHALLDISKIKALGWKPRINLQQGLSQTLSVWA